jgi:hypothetical protein
MTTGAGDAPWQAGYRPRVCSGVLRASRSATAVSNKDNRVPASSCAGSVHSLYAKTFLKAPFLEDVHSRTIPALCASRISNRLAPLE